MQKNSIAKTNQNKPNMHISPIFIPSEFQRLIRFKGFLYKRSGDGFQHIPIYGWISFIYLNSNGECDMVLFYYYLFIQIV